MRKLLTIALFAGSIYLHAQAPAIEWEHSYELPNNGSCYNASATSDGGHIIVGVNSPDTSNGVDCLITKVDASGNLEWSKSYGESDFDGALNAVQTPDGGYIVCATTYSYNVPGGSGDPDIWILKLDVLGELEWQKLLGGPGDDHPHKIICTTDGGYILAAQSQSVSGDITGHHGSWDHSDAWVAKLTATGQITWQTSLGGTNEDMAYGITQLVEGGYIIVGTTSSADGNVTVNHGGQDLWVVKLNVLGGIEWEKTYGGSGNEYGIKIAEIEEGYILAGNTTSNDGQVTLNHGGKDYWLLKIGHTGELLWQKTYGGLGDDGCNGVSIIEGGYLLYGSTEAEDGWVGKVDQQGTVLWEKFLGAIGNNGIINVFQSADNGFMIVGKVIDTDEGGADLYVAKLAPEALSRPDVLKTISMFPNPVRSALNINSQEPVSSVSIFDMQGRKVREMDNISQSSFVIDVSGLSPAVYMVEAVTASGKQVSKVIVE